MRVMNEIQSCLAITQTSRFPYTVDWNCKHWNDRFTISCLTNGSLYHQFRYIEVFMPSFMLKYFIHIASRMSAMCYPRRPQWGQ